MFIKDYENNRAINVDMICEFHILSGEKRKWIVELSMSNGDKISYNNFDSYEEATDFIDIVLEFKDKNLNSASLDFILATLHSRG